MIIMICDSYDSYQHCLENIVCCHFMFDAEEVIFKTKNLTWSIIFISFRQETRLLISLQMFQMLGILKETIPRMSLSVTDAVI